jgi:polygalacturonase
MAPLRLRLAALAIALAGIAPFAGAAGAEPGAPPFPPRPELPRIPDASFDVRDFGALPGADASEAIRRAFLAANAAGGGTVRIPPGRWRSGPIELPSRTGLRVEGGATLLFSGEAADYLPPVPTRFEGTELLGYRPLVSARDCSDVALTGDGRLEGRGPSWWRRLGGEARAIARLHALAHAGVPVAERVFASEAAGLRPSFVQTFRCRNVLIEGVTLADAPMWAIHPVYSENVTVRGVTVLSRGPNGDGVDPDSSRNVWIEESRFRTGDDCIALKAGRDADGLRVGLPTENAVIRRIRCEGGHAGVAIGSETSGGVRNVWVHDSDFSGLQRGVRIKSQPGRGGFVEDVWLEDLRMVGIVRTALEVTAAYRTSRPAPRGGALPRIDRIRVRGLEVRGAGRAIDLQGLAGAPIQSVRIEDARIRATLGVRCAHCLGVDFRRVRVDALRGPAFLAEESRWVRVDGRALE